MQERDSTKDQINREATLGNSSTNEDNEILGTTEWRDSILSQELANMLASISDHSVIESIGVSISSLDGSSRFVLPRFDLRGCRQIDILFELNSDDGINNASLKFRNYMTDVNLNAKVSLIDGSFYDAKSKSKVEIEPEKRLEDLAVGQEPQIVILTALQEVQARLDTMNTQASTQRAKDIANGISAIMSSGELREYHVDDVEPGTYVTFYQRKSHEGECDGFYGISVREVVCIKAQDGSFQPLSMALNFDYGSFDFAELFAANGSQLDHSCQVFQDDGGIDFLQDFNFSKFFEETAKSFKVGTVYSRGTN